MKGLAVSALVAVGALLPTCAVPSLLSTSQTPPTQVVYRFDHHRWLELTGWGCEGALTYVDAKQDIRTEVSPQFYRIVFFTYIHPSTHYIAVPYYGSMSAIRVSRDGGRTFDDARIAIGFPGRYGDSQSIDPQEVKRFVVVNDRGYIETKDNGRVLQSSLPIGNYWGMNYIDYPLTKKDRNMTLYDRPEFQDMKSKVPEVRNYTGWTHMKCDPNVGVK